MRLHDGRYELTMVEEGRDGQAPEYLSVSIEGEGLRATLVSYDPDGFSGLVRYFEDLASDSFEGWQGVRTFESLEGDVRLAATTKRHIELAQTLKPGIAEAGWRIEAQLTVEKGEQIRQASRDLAAELRRP
jgi:Family of unknown function (DUF6228)